MKPELASMLPLKNPYRKLNFDTGILRTDHVNPRLYIWERKGLLNSMLIGLKTVPPELRSEYFCFVRERLAVAFSLPNLRILEYPRFEHWMTRLTRNSPHTVMVSGRDKVTTRVAHAFNFDVSDPVIRNSLTAVVQASLQAKSLATTRKPDVSWLRLLPFARESGEFTCVKETDAEHEKRLRSLPDDTVCVKDFGIGREGDQVYLVNEQARQLEEELCESLEERSTDKSL